ncbi:MAG TPA: hypothetical protein PK919_11255, partial [Candidatus Aminicenantes bacterium]|nr:hypothetical protein [Candidatus Aminicenantes bacterium]
MKPQEKKSPQKQTGPQAARHRPEIRHPRLADFRRADEEAQQNGVQAPHPAAAGVFASLLPELQRAIAEEGYAVPTPIQAKAIPHLL